MTHYGLNKIWDFQATRSRTFTLYNYIYKVNDSVSRARGSRPTEPRATTHHTDQALRSLSPPPR